MTMAAALEEKVITPDTGVIVPPRLPRAGVNFKDNEPHGVENMTATGVIASAASTSATTMARATPTFDALT